MQRKYEKKPVSFEKPVGALGNLCWNEVHELVGFHSRFASSTELTSVPTRILGATLVVTETPVPKEEELYVDHIFGAKNKPFIFTALTVTWWSQWVLYPSFGSGERNETRD